MIETTDAAPVDDAAILRQAEAWRRTGRGVALATVVETFGSAPRPVGSHLVVEESGLFCGSVSAGCVEGDVMAAAAETIDDGRSRLLEFGVADDVAWRAGLSCGGRIVVAIDRLDSARLALLSDLNAEIASRRACALVTPVDGGDARVIRSQDLAFASPGDALAGPLRDGASALVEDAGRRFFVNVRLPGPRLIIVGAVHIAQALAPMAKLAGFDVIILDPRAAFAAPERFPDAQLDVRWPDEALPAIGLDAFTALALLTHDPKIDDIALRAALESDCFYVGALGSQATQARRVARLAAIGVGEHTIARLRAPIGVDIAAITPAEIAIATLAEIILARGRKPRRRPAAPVVSAGRLATCGVRGE